MAKNLNNISEVTRGCHVVILYTLGQSIKVLSTLIKVIGVSHKNSLIKTSLGYFSLKDGSLIEKHDKSINNMAHPHKLFVGFKPETVVAEVGATVSVLTLTEGSPQVVYTRDRRITRVGRNNGVISALSLNDGNDYYLESDGFWYRAYTSSFGFKCKDVIIDNVVG